MVNCKNPSPLQIILEVYLNAKNDNISISEASIKNRIILDFEVMQMIMQSILLNTENPEVSQNKVIFKLNKSLNIFQCTANNQYPSVFSSMTKGIKHYVFIATNVFLTILKLSAGTYFAEPDEKSSNSETTNLFVCILL